VGMCECSGSHSDSNPRSSTAIANAAGVIVRSVSIDVTPMSIRSCSRMYLPPMPLDSLPSRFLTTLAIDTVSVPPHVIANGPIGTRVIATATKGRMEGPVLNGELVAVAGGDWVTVRANGTLSLDVRIAWRTDDGADILMTYLGFGKRTAEGGLDIRIAPRFETGDERYAWLNDAFCVGFGATDAGGVRYDVYEVL
jgi:hypothetical protein